MYVKFSRINIWFTNNIIVAQNGSYLVKNENI